MKNLYIIYTLMMLGLVGCNGIGGTGGTIDDTVTTPKSNKVFKGKVSQVSTKSQEFTVNGVQFKHTGAQITRDSQVIDADKIEAGQIITVEAKDENEDGVFEASTIVINEQLLGPIEAIDLNLSTITILGQTVLITDATSFNQKSFATLVLNNYLAVFGFRREDGVLEATLIELVKEEFSAALDTVKVGGEVTAVNAETGTVTVDGVDINVGLLEIKNIDVGDVLSLENLEVNTSGPEVITTDVKEPSNLVEDQNYEIDSEIVLEGIPRRIIARNDFSLNGYQVFVPIELMDKANIESVSGRQIVIEGVFVGEKEIVAKSIRAEEAKDFELRGNLESSTDENTILVFGQKILINRFTSLNFELEDILSEIGSGAVYTVYVKGYIESNGDRVASDISLKAVEDSENATDKINGKIESITDGVIIVSGVSVRLRDLVEYKNEDATIAGSALLELLSVGDDIEVSGEFTRDNVFLVNSLRNNSLDSTKEVEGQTKLDSIK